MLKRILIGLLLLVVLSIVLFLAGPKVKYTEPYDSEIKPLSISIEELDQYIQEKEGEIKDLKANNEARIIWNDSLPQKTEYSVVYLHGFSASQIEGDPIHEDFAKRYGANLYLSRLADHGRLDSNSFINLTPAQLIQSAKEAIAIGHEIGENVIVMSCSTGSTLSAYLASNPKNNIHSQIMYSPNLELYDPMSELLLGPWAERLLKQVSGGDYRNVNYGPIPPKFWNKKYHNNGAMAVKHLIHETMTDAIFKKVNQPLFLGYYYKNEELQDKVVSVERMKQFARIISTPKDEISIKAFPDVGFHVMASHIFSQDLESVKKETYDFAEKTLGLKAVDTRK